MKEPLKFSPSKIKIKESLNLTNLNLSLQNKNQINIKSESFNNKNSDNIHNTCLTERKIRTNKLNIIDDKTKSVTKRLPIDNKEDLDIEKKDEREKSNSQNKSKIIKKRILKTNSIIPKLPIHTLETVKENNENEENEGISTSTSANSRLEGKKMSMLQQYFGNLKKNKNLTNISNDIMTKKKVNPISYTKLFKNESTEYNNNNNSKKIINKSYDKNKSVENYYKDKLNISNKKNLLDYSNFEESVNIEDLIILEGKIEVIEEFIQEKKYDLLNKICFEWLNFYFNCSLKGNLTHFFIDSKVKKIIEESNLLILISIIVIYDLSFKQEFFESNIKVILSMLSFNNKNYLLICNNFLSKIKKEFLNSVWVERLRIITINRVNNKEYYITDI